MTTHVIGTIAPAVDREDPIEHTLQAVHGAIDDLNRAIWTADSQHALVLMKDDVLTLIKRLEMSWADAQTLDEHWEDMRRK